MTITSVRQPKGIPSGGQFAATSHAEPDLALDHDGRGLSFGHDGASFELECDGEGRYTVYNATGDELTSFTSTGDPNDHADLEEAAVAALEEQKERLAPVATPGARVLWTDGGGRAAPQFGKVSSSTGEIVNVAFGDGTEAQVFASELKPEAEALAALIPPVPLKRTETQRRIRGHIFYPPQAVGKKVPAIGSGEHIAPDDKHVHLHYFASGSANWYITEMDSATGKAFGYADPTGYGGEWGTIDLPALEKVNLGGYRVVERDCYFSQGSFAEVAGGRR